MRVIILKCLNIKLRKINIRVSENIKIITIMTLIIVSILILLPVFFLSTGKESNNIFNLNSENIIKSSEITFPVNGKVKVYHK